MKKVYKKLLKGALFGFIVNAITNLVSFGTIQFNNSILGVVIGALLYFLINGKWE